jgi:Peptidase inhibitor family I36
MSMSRRIAVTTAALAVATGGLALGANPASAAFSDCPTNHVCLWTGQNGTGTLVFDQDASHMFNVRQAFQVPGGRAASASNRSLGTFCTYNHDLSILTDTLVRGDVPNLANHVTDWIKFCG